ncbi:MAG: GAF domain-containing sensor histidine kinase [Acidobacteriota bacterium]
MEHAAEDPRWADHPARLLYGVEAYVSVPLLRRDGSSFGVLCALDTVPKKLGEEDLSILQLVASLISYELESEDEHRRKEDAIVLASEEAVARERLMGILGHDLRTPLTAILLGSTDLLQHEELGESAERTVVGIVSSARRAGRMISDLLDFTRARLGGGIPVQRVETDLLAVSRKVVSELAAAHPGREIKVTSSGVTHGSWDPDRAAQVVSNLVSNALRHGSAGSDVSVLIDGDDSCVALSVSNQTRAIPQSTLADLFSPFRQGGGGSSEGLGLGLFIVEQIVSAHGGKVSVRSDATETTFVTEWPRG